MTSEAPLPPLADRDYVMAALPDLNADGRSDILWYHQSSGERLAWNMNGTTVTSTTAMGLNADTDWRIAGTGALGGDTRADVVFRHEALGQNILLDHDGRRPEPAGPARRDRPRLARGGRGRRERRRPQPTCTGAIATAATASG